VTTLEPLERLAALEDAIAELRQEVTEANLPDLRRTADRVRELLLDFAELIDESITRS
jgi:hypothetical protein